MIRMHFLTPDKDPNSVACNLPLKINRRRLLDMGIAVRLFISPKFFAEPGSEFFDCDVACIDNRVFRYTRREKKLDLIFSFLEAARERVGALLWFDTTDGTGSPQFDVLPFVTAYYKSSVLKDRSHYLTAEYSRPKFLEFFEERSGIKDDNCKPQTGRPSEKDLSRIHVSWNSSLGHFGPLSRVNRNLLKLFQPPLAFLAGHTKPGNKRPLDITCRVSTGHKLHSLRFHRSEIAALLAKKYNVRTGKINRRAFLKEMRTAKVGVSPFGNGEIAYRDFEIFCCGAALLKPDMSFIDTWPDLYLDNRTYISHRWDLSDIDEKLDLLLSGDKWREIAETGQNTYRSWLLSGEKRNAFCSRILSIAERHLN